MAYNNNNSMAYPHLLKQQQTPQLQIPSEILDELISRFVMNIPEEERQDAIRVCFQIELAHWFFVDNYCGEDKSEFWKQLGLIQFLPFASLIFQRTPYLQRELRNVEKIVQDFKEYKMKVPTFGAILMDKDLSQVVLVQGFGGQWGFPKGKINKDEDPADCAAREVQEETGYDCSPLLNRNNFIESCCNERWTRLYIIRGVDRSIILKPHTRYEIKNIGWFRISELPECKKDPSVITRPGFPHTAFHNIFPYIKRLRRWIEDKLHHHNHIEFFKSNAPNRPDHILDRNWKPNQRNRKPSSSSSNNSQPTDNHNPLSVFLTKPIFSQTQAPPQQIQIQQSQNPPIQLFQPPKILKQEALKPAIQNQDHYMKTINPKRRLFVSDADEEGDLSTILLQSKMTKLKIEGSPKTELKLKEEEGKEEVTKNSGFSLEDLILPSPSSWTNFKLNSDEIIRAMSLTSSNSNLQPLMKVKGGPNNVPQPQKPQKRTEQMNNSNRPVKNKRPSKRK